MRVLMVSAHGDDPSAGGVERLLIDLSAGLSARGVEVAFLQAFPPRGDVGDYPRTVLHRTDWRDDHARRLLDHVGDVLARPGEELARAIAGHRPDVVHTHNLPGITTAAWEVARRLDVPIVHSLHDYYLFCPRVTLTRRDGDPCRPSPLLCGFRSRRLARWAPAVSQVIGVSQYLLDLHAELFPRAERHLIRHPMSAPVSGSVRPPAPQPRVLGYIGTLDRAKGVHLLLEAAPRLQGLGFDIRIAGDGRMRDEVAAAAARLPNVEWDGQVLGDRKQAFFAACDVGVVPSVWAEPGGPTFTMVEWLSAGRPVLVSTRGGLGEVAGVYPGSLPVEPATDSIVESVSALLEGDRWSELVASVRPIESDHGVEEWVGRHEAIYRSGLATAASSGRGR